MKIRRGVPLNVPRIYQEENHLLRLGQEKKEKKVKKKVNR